MGYSRDLGEDPRSVLLTIGTMLLLAIDTSGPQGGVAVLDGEQVIAAEVLTLDGKASTTLLPTVDQVLQRAGIKHQDLDALAVALGPGSFTGIRIGLATSQGIAQALALPVYGLSSLRVLAAPYSGGPGPLAVLRRARAGECYFCVYDDHWNELVPEGRYPDDQIRVLLHERAPLALLIESGSTFTVPGADISSQSVTVQISCFGRLVRQLGPDLSRPGGAGLSPRHYSPSFRTKKP